MNTILVAASVDLGVAADGARLGPKTILNHFHHQKSVSVEADPSIIKSRNKNDLRKNEAELLKYNTGLYHTILNAKKDGYFSLLLGGDHSAAIPSALSSAVVYGNIGVMTTQSMLNEEFQVAKLNIYEEASDMFLSEFCIYLY